MATAKRRASTARTKTKTTTRKKPASSNNEKFEPNPNSVALFPVDSDAEKAPDFSGKIVLDQELADFIAEGNLEIEIAVWKRKANSGLRYLSGIVKEPYVAEDQSEEEDEDFDDEDDWGDDDF